MQGWRRKIRMCLLDRDDLQVHEPDRLRSGHSSAYRIGNALPRPR